MLKMITRLLGCGCGCGRAAHRHYRAGTDCGLCGCGRFRWRFLPGS